MLIGVFDILVICGVIFLNYHFWKEKPLKISEWILLSICCLILFSVVLPFVSSAAERALFNWFNKEEIVDGFEGLYIFLRWPSYWVLGFFELLYLLLITFGARNITSVSSGLERGSKP